MIDVLKYLREKDNAIGEYKICLIVEDIVNREHKYEAVEVDFDDYLANRRSHPFWIIRSSSLISLSPNRKDQSYT